MRGTASPAPLSRRNRTTRWLRIHAARAIGACAFGLASLAGPSCATVITSLPSGTALVIPDAQQNTAGPVVADGYVFTATTARADFGDRNGYSLGGNGAWLDFGPWIGLNVRTGSMTLTFDKPVASFLAFVNYAPGTADPPSIAAYDAGNRLIEAFSPLIATPGLLNAGAWLGFGESENIIQSIRFSNAFIVATGLTVAAAVPEPQSLGLLAIGLIGAGVARRTVRPSRVRRAA